VARADGAGDDVAVARLKGRSCTAPERGAGRVVAFSATATATAPSDEREEAPRPAPPFSSS